MIVSAASEAKQRTVGDAINSFTDGMTTFDDREVVKTRKKRSGLHQSVFLWGATPVSLGKTKEMGWQGPLAGASPSAARSASASKRSLAQPGGLYTAAAA